MEMTGKSNKLIQFLEKYYLWLLFAFGVGVSFFLFSYPCRYATVPDESRYLNLARSTLEGKWLYIHNAPQSFQKVLYSFFLIPAMLINSPTASIGTVHLTNAILMASAVFPTYLLAKNALKSKLSVAAVCFLAVTIPEMGLVITFMSENLYYPLSLWLILGIYFTFRYTGKQKYKLSCGIGLLCYLCFLCKEIAIVYILAYLCATALEIIVERRWKEPLISAGLFVGIFTVVFVLCKLTVFAGLGDGYDQTSLSALGTPGAVKYLFYAFFVILAWAVIGFGIAPVVLPIFGLKSMPKELVKLYIFTIFSLVWSVAIISYTISIREDFGKVTPRLHTRYFFALIIPFLICCLGYMAVCKFSRKMIPVVSLLVLFLTKSAKSIYIGSPVDEFNLEFLGTVAGKLNNGLLFRVALLVGVILLLTCCLILIKRHRNLLSGFLIFFMLALNVLNFQAKSKFLYKEYYTSPLNVAEATNVIQQIGTSKEDSIFISSGIYDQNLALLDTYCKYSNIIWISWDTMNSDKIITVPGIAKVRYFICAKTKKTPYYLRPQNSRLVFDGNCFVVYRLETIETNGTIKMVGN